MRYTVVVSIVALALCVGAAWWLTNDIGTTDFAAIAANKTPSTSNSSAVPAQPVVELRVELGVEPPARIVSVEVRRDKLASKIVPSFSAKTGEITDKIVRSDKRVPTAAELAKLKIEVSFESSLDDISRIWNVQLKPLAKTIYRVNLSGRNKVKGKLAFVGKTKVNYDFKIICDKKGKTWLEIATNSQMIGFAEPKVLAGTVIRRVKR